MAKADNPIHRSHLMVLDSPDDIPYCTRCGLSDWAAKGECTGASDPWGFRQRDTDKED